MIEQSQAAGLSGKAISGKGVLGRNGPKGVFARLLAILEKHAALQTRTNFGHHPAGKSQQVRMAAYLAPGSNAKPSGTTPKGLPQAQISRDGKAVKEMPGASADSRETAALPLIGMPAAGNPGGQTASLFKPASNSQTHIQPAGKTRADSASQTHLQAGTAEGLNEAESVQQQTWKNSLGAGFEASATSGLQSTPKTKAPAMASIEEGMPGPAAGPLSTPLQQADDENRLDIKLADGKTADRQSPASATLNAATRTAGPSHPESESPRNHEDATLPRNAAVSPRSGSDPIRENTASQDLLTHVDTGNRSGYAANARVGLSQAHAQSTSSQPASSLSLQGLNPQVSAPETMSSDAGGQQGADRQPQDGRAALGMIDPRPTSPAQSTGFSHLLHHKAETGMSMLESIQYIAQSARDGKTRLEIQLEPAHLGKIHVSLQTDAAKQLQVHLIADQNSTRQAIEQQLPALRQALAQQGLDLSGFSMGSHGDGNPFQEQPSTPGPAIEPMFAAEKPSTQPEEPRMANGRVSIHV